MGLKGHRGPKVDKVPSDHTAIKVSRDQKVKKESRDCREKRDRKAPQAIQATRESQGSKVPED